MKTLVGYKLKQADGCVYCPKTRLLATGSVVLSKAQIDASPLLRVVFREGGFDSVYEETGDKGAPAPLPSGFDEIALKKMNKTKLLAIASKEYDPSTLEEYTKDDLIRLILGQTE